MQKGGLGVGDQAVLEKLEKEYGTELAALKNQVNQNTKDINDLKNGVGRFSFDGMVRVQYDHDKDEHTNELDPQNRRFYFNLNGAYKVNDHWKAKFQIEKNTTYEHNAHSQYNRNETGLPETYTGYKGWSGHDGNIQRIWVEGYNPHSGAWISIGRAWRGLGAQNMFLGIETDGVQAGVPIPGTHLTGSAFYMTQATGDWDVPNWYGVGTWGNIGHNVGINLAYAKSGQKDKTPAFDNAYVLSGWWNVVKNVEFKVDYTKTNANVRNHGIFYRLNYRNTDLSKPGSYQLYTRYIYKGENGHINGDDEWNSIPSVNGGLKGWFFGVKYVPWQNIEWETLYAHEKTISDSDWSRNLFRTQMDFHF